MAVIRDVILAKKRTSSTLEPKVIYQSGTTMAIDYEGSSRVKGRPGYVWVKENNQSGAVFQCFSPVVKDTAGLAVIIAHKLTKPLRRMVIDVDWDKIPIEDRGQSFGVPKHGATHEWPDMRPGDDAIHVYLRALMPLRVFPTTPGVGVGVMAGAYIYNGVYVEYPGTSFYDLASGVPVVAPYSRFVLVYLDPETNAVSHVNGVEDIIISTMPTRPDSPAGMIPLAYIVLTSGMIRTSEATIYLDARPLITTSESITELRRYIINNIAMLEHEIDYELSRHIVEG